MRRWGRHIDQAFIGQWCLTIQSATKPRGPADLAGVTDGTLYYPVLNDVLKAAEDRRRILDAPGASDAGDIDLPECVTLAADVCDAWRSCVSASEKAGPTYAAWIDRCDGSIENVGHVVGTGPQDTAQKTLSGSVLQNQVVELDAAMAADSSHGAQVRRANWCAEFDGQAGRWVRAIPWDREGYLSLSNTAYRIAFARRYRLSRPTCARTSACKCIGDSCRCSRNSRAPQPQPVCTCGVDLTHGGNFIGHDGDHDESDCTSRAWVKTLAHKVQRTQLRVLTQQRLNREGE